MARRVAVTLASLLMLAAAGCSTEGAANDVDEQAVDSVEVPELGACRNLEPADAAESSNATETVDCAEPHTAETFAVGSFPDRVLGDGDYDSPALGRYIYRTCSDRFEGFLGGEESAVMRSLVSWVWFRPSEAAWADGARWYRCDIVGGGEESTEYAELPETAEGLLLGRPDDRWMSCVDGPTIAGATKIPCSEPHTWRAVTTIKLGDEDDPYPGDRLVEVKTRDFCSDSVGAWLNYPVDYEFGYTWFHEAEWKAGNRRSICWARTEQ